MFVAVEKVRETGWFEELNETAILTYLWSQIGIVALIISCNHEGCIYAPETIS